MFKMIDLKIKRGTDTKERRKSKSTSKVREPKIKTVWNVIKEKKKCR